ncbi:MAG: hypothetical protein ABI227_06560 [Rhodanobacter sp.]
MRAHVTERRVRHNAPDAICKDGFSPFSAVRNQPRRIGSCHAQQRDELKQDLACHLESNIDLIHAIHADHPIIDPGLSRLEAEYGRLVPGNLDGVYH